MVINLQRKTQMISMNCPINEKERLPLDVRKVHT